MINEQGADLTDWTQQTQKPETEETSPETRGPDRSVRPPGRVLTVTLSEEDADVLQQYSIGYASVRIPGSVTEALVNLDHAIRAAKLVTEYDYDGSANVGAYYVDSTLHDYASPNDGNGLL
jgi:hypothetical protein